MTRSLNVIGFILLIVGALWAFQGLGLVGGSVMTGERRWLIIGVLTGAVGTVLLLRANLRRP